MLRMGVPLGDGVDRVGGKNIKGRTSLKLNDPAAFVKSRRDSFFFPARQENFKVVD